MWGLHSIELEKINLSYISNTAIASQFSIVCVNVCMYICLYICMSVSNCICTYIYWLLSDRKYRDLFGNMNTNVYIVRHCCFFLTSRKFTGTYPIKCAVLFVF